MSKNSKGAVVSALVGASMLVSAGAAYATPLEAPNAEGAAGIDIQSESSAVAETAYYTLDNVQGDFAFTQEALTPNLQMTNVFSKAAATLCVALPTYGIAECEQALTIAVDNQQKVVATVDELADDESFESSILACACSTNGPGGGAMAQAEVSGVSLATIFAQAAA